MNAKLFLSGIITFCLLSGAVLFFIQESETTEPEHDTEVNETMNVSNRGDDHNTTSSPDKDGDTKTEFAFLYSATITDYVISEVNTLDLVIIQPYLNEEDRDAIEVPQGIYFSISEFDGAKEGLEERNLSPAILDYNENWNSYGMNVSNEEWRSYAKGRVEELVTAGYDAIFLDNVDTSQIYPGTEEAMVSLIKEFDEAFPDTAFIMNRGFFLFEKVKEDIDFILYENFATRYDFEEETYRKLDESEQKRLMRRMKMLKNSSVEVLALGYASEPCNELHKYLISTADAHNVSYSASNLHIDQYYPRNC